MRRNVLAGSMFLLVSLFLSLNAGAATQEHSEFTDAFIKSVFDDHELRPAVQLLINKNIPIQMIIEAALKAGHDDGAITAALYQSSLPYDQAILYSMQSHMSSTKVLKSLEKQGVDTEVVLHLLIHNNADTNCILSTFKYLLDQGYSKYQAMERLMIADADRNIIIRVTKHFNIPPAIVMEAYQEVYGDFGHFGHVYNRHSLPQPAILAVGLARINSDICRPVISPSKP